ncbi:Rint1-like protein mag2l [Thalictrum thalictroides]|uniref:Rint1-like protein mag2l n=1 Tax=Thalictrum thalictroides TaxID=46969 RepID=A0A7J6XBZ6_THATH|nr:Rint1-like protein mag2l [Thalictrum thalictroides]
MESLLVLPNPTNGFSPNLLKPLNEHFNTHEDLTKVSTFYTEIKKDCGYLDRKLTTLQKTLSSLISQWISLSNSLKTLFHRLNRKFHYFGLDPSSDMMERVDLKILREELWTLSKELHLIETFRCYVETTLSLEVLVGEFEDAVICVMNQKKSNLIDFRWKQAKLLLSLRAMNDIENILVSILKNHSKWCNLVKSVDDRVDKPLNTLRLHALADHKALLSSIGWPPSLVASEAEGGKGSELLNPLVLMQGEMKERYSQIFLVLCSLQQLHSQREERKKSDSLGDRRNVLWTIHEMVSPIALKCEHHFSKWFDQPKFIFALVYKITRDFVVGVDDVLQPLIDIARLVGCSAREDWVCAMTDMLSTYLRKSILPVLAEKYREKHTKEHIIYSWLHLVDLMIAFDKRMHTLADLGTAHIAGELINSSKEISLMSIFCDQTDWLKIWAKIELKDALKKLNSELENPRAWTINSTAKSNTEFEDGPFILSSREDFKAPLIVDAVVKITQAMIEQCQTLPNIFLRAQFIRLSSLKFLWHFFNILLKRCTEIVNMASNLEEDGSMKVCGSVNAARYCESILQEWSEDVSFIEMRMAEDDWCIRVKGGQDYHCNFFWEEVKFLIKFETDWIADIMAYLLRQFDSSCQGYLQNKEQWSWNLEHWGVDLFSGSTNTVSVDFVGALDVLRNQLSVLETGLNSKDFLYLWRSIADGLDQFIFRSIVMSGVTFSDQGVNQFSTDMQALFLVFQPFCVRPEAFFPCIRDSLKMFQMELEGAKHLQSTLDKKCKRKEILQLCGIAYVSPDEAEYILRYRQFGV